MRSSEGKYLGVFALSPKTKKSASDRVALAPRVHGEDLASARGSHPRSRDRRRRRWPLARHRGPCGSALATPPELDCFRRHTCSRDKKSFARTCCPSWKLMYPLSSLSTSFAMASSLSALILYPKYLRSRWHLSRTFHGLGMFQPSLLTRRETSSTGISCVSAISFLAISLWLPAPWHFEMARGRRCG